MPSSSLPLKPNRDVEATTSKALGNAEFVALSATMMGMLALSVDLILPALSAVGLDLGIENDNHNQFIVAIFILGLAIGQLFYGPLSDSFGRKPAIVLGLAIFGIGCAVSFIATDMQTMLIGRGLQGFGAAGPRIVTIALIRDQFSGSQMARIMSIVIAILMVGPLIAPFLGQGVLLVAHWRIAFALLIILDLVVWIWLTVRQPETLPRNLRVSLSGRAVASATREVMLSRISLGYAAAGGLVTGELFAYVNSAEQIYQDVYDVGVWFPFCFAVTGVAIAAASLTNARLLKSVGMRTLCGRAAFGKFLMASLLFFVSYRFSGSPPLEATLILLFGFFFCAGILFGNLNALAMEPVGHIAGLAAGVIGSVTWFSAMVFATVVSQQFDGTIAPLSTGFVVLSTALILVIHWAGVDRGKLVRHS